MLLPVSIKSAPCVALPDTVLPVPACKIVNVRLSPSCSINTSLSSASTGLDIRPINAKTPTAKFLIIFIIFLQYWFIFIL